MGTRRNGGPDYKKNLLLRQSESNLIGENVCLARRLKEIFFSSIGNEQVTSTMIRYNPKSVSLARDTFNLRTEIWTNT